MLIYYVKQALWLTVLMSAPIVILTMIIGLVLGFLQAVFQLQDQSFPFAFKILGSILLMIVLGPWMSGNMIEFFNLLLEQIRTI